jgi:hypothetical protein
MFDPHNHLGGIIPYRVYSLLAGPSAADDPGGRGVAERLLDTFGDDLASEVGFAVGLDDVEDYLAHHELTRDGLVVKVKPPESPKVTDPVWVSQRASEDGVTRRVVESAAFARLELALMLRFYSIVAGMLERARATGDWGGKRARIDAGSGVLDLAVEVTRQLAVPDWRGVVERPEQADLGLAKPVKHLLQNVFTATPLTDYDTAYVTRGFLSSTRLFSTGRAPIPPANGPEMLAAAMRELQRQGIEYAEVSIGADDVVTMLDDEDARAVLAQGPVRTGWLAQIPNPQIVEPRNEAAFETTRKLVGAALERPEVAGFTVLAPEVTDYGTSPATVEQRLGQLMGLVEGLAPRRLVAHIHVGEGAAVWDLARQVRMDLLLGKRAKVAPAVDREATQRAAAVARGNVSVIIDALPVEIPTNVRVRFGHVTHASPAQAVRMRERGIWADVNLTSNVATGAWFTGGEVDVKRVDVQRYEGHGVFALTDAGVRFVLGTDGSGVEHSALTVDYAVLDHLAHLKSPASPWVRQSLQNGADHIAWMARKTSPSNVPVREGTQTASQASSSSSSGG